MKALLEHARLSRPVLFVAGNLLALAVIVSVLVLPVHSFFAERDDLVQQKAKVLARLSAIALQEKNVQSVLSDTSTEMRSGEFLAGPNDNVISAELQAKLKSMTEAAGAQTRAVQALPVRTTDQLRYSGSRIEVAGSLRSIQRAIHAIESAKPYLFVSGAVLKLQPPAGRPDGKEEPVIQVQLDVFGAMQTVGREP